MGFPKCASNKHVLSIEADNFLHLITRLACKTFHHRRDCCHECHLNVENSNLLYKKYI